MQKFIITVTAPQYIVEAEDGLEAQKKLIEFMERELPKTDSDLGILFTAYEMPSGEFYPGTGIFPLIPYGVYLKEDPSIAKPILRDTL